MKTEYKDFIIDIEYDNYSESPREWDNQAKIITFHPRYTIGDKHSFTQDSLSELIESGEVYFLPVFMYEHSGITISTAPFSCRFDSGKIGYAYIPKNEVESEEIAFQVIESEIKTLDSYLSGEVYYYQIIDNQGEVLDSCGDYYGYEYCLNDAKSMVDYFNKTLPKQFELELA